MAKTYRVKAVQHKEEVSIKVGRDGIEYFIVPEMNMDGREFLVTQHPVRGKSWFITTETPNWNYHKSWLIFLDTVSKKKRK